MTQTSSVAYLTALFVGWTVFSSLTDALTKASLLAWPRPLTLTFFQFFASLLFSGAISLTGVQKVQNVWRILGPRTCTLYCLSHTVGFLLTNFTLTTVAIAFMQTVKVR